MEGLSGTVSITGSSICGWNAESNVSWIHTVSSGSGNGTVSYSVDANPGDSRSGTITIGDQAFTITQSMHCQVFCPLQAQTCVSQIPVEVIETTCEQEILQQHPECVQNPGPCIEWIQGCKDGYLQQAQQACTYEFDQCQNACHDICNYSLSAASASLPASASSGTVTISSVACNWAAASNAGWLHLTSGSAGNGNTDVVYSADANTGPARTGTLTIADQTLTVTQANGCTFSLSSSSASVGAAASSGNNIQLTSSNAGCGWTASSNAGWLHPAASGTGSGATFAVDANQGPARTGTITIGGKSLSVTQANGCTYSLSSSISNVGAAASSGNSIQLVCSNAGCGWTASSNAGWLHPATSGTGSGATFAVDANQGPARTGTITIGGKSLTVNQADGCTYSISPTGTSISIDGGSNNYLSVNCSSGCGWSATSNANWIHITSGSNGTGTGYVVYSVDPTGSNRSGTITAAGKTFTVTQNLTCPQVCQASAQACSAQVSQIMGPACQDMCNQQMMQIPLCIAQPSYCVGMFQACVTGCMGQAQQACTSQYDQCMASCN